MNWVVRGLLAVQAVVFLSAASIHFGVLLDGYRHRQAGMAESVIAAVLLVGLILTSAPRPWAWRAAIAADLFGLFGVLVGLSMIAIGVGPRTPLDFVLHAIMLLLLTGGLMAALQLPAADALLLNSGRERRSTGDASSV